MNQGLTALIAGAAFTVSACGSSDTPAPIVETTGSAIFERRALGDQPGCVTCHSLAEGVVLVGPSLSDISGSAQRAGFSDTRAYVRNSIEDPTAHVVPGFEDGKQMPTTFGELLSEVQIEAVVDYLVGRTDD